MRNSAPIATPTSTRIYKTSKAMLRGAEKARFAKKNGAQGDSYHGLLNAGEIAARKGLTVDACPYGENDDRREDWIEGFNDYFATL